MENLRESFDQVNKTFIKYKEVVEKLRHIFRNIPNIHQRILEIYEYQFKKSYIELQEKGNTDGRFYRMRNPHYKRTRALANYEFFTEKLTDEDRFLKNTYEEVPFSTFNKALEDLIKEEYEVLDELRGRSGFYDDYNEDGYKAMECLTCARKVF